MRYKPISPEKLREAQDLLARGVRRKEVARMCGISKSAVHRIANPASLARYREYMTERRRANGIEQREMLHVVPPAYVLAERAERLSRPYKSLTQKLMGDPV